MLGRRMAGELENVNDAFPDRLAAKRLFDGHGLGKRSHTVMLSFDGVLQVADGYFGAGHTFTARSARDS